MSLHRVLEFPKIYRGLSSPGSGHGTYPHGQIKASDDGYPNACADARCGLWSIFLAMEGGYPANWARPFPCVYVTISRDGRNLCHGIGGGDSISSRLIRCRIQRRIAPSPAGRRSSADGARDCASHTRERTCSVVRSGFTEISMDASARVEFVQAGSRPLHSARERSHVGGSGIRLGGSKNHTLLSGNRGASMYVQEACLKRRGLKHGSRAIQSGVIFRRDHTPKDNRYGSI